MIIAYLLCILMYVALVVFQCLDVYSTYRIIAEKKGKEANPFMIKALDLVSTAINKIWASPPVNAYVWVGLTIPKLVIMGALLWAMPYAHIYADLGILLVLLIIYALVLKNNFGILNKPK